MPVINIRGIEIDFPFKPYDVQVDYMTKVIESLQTRQNAVLESPTGTGKTLCLLCATIAWRKAEIANQVNKSSDLKNLPDGLSAWQENTGQQSFSVPRIIYASRTHSQLTQVVNELKRTTYGKNISIAVLGSREQMCVHPEVSKQTNNQTMVHMCRNKVNKRLCQFYNNVENSVKHGTFTNKVMDIEDLATIGLQRNACPYYAAREISKQSDCSIIFTPYNYLLDKRSRRSHNLEIAGNIIIFDEAHNLEKQCEESASFDMTSLDFAHCIEEVGDLLKAVTKMSESGVVADGHEAGESAALTEFKKEDLAVLKQLFLVLEKQLDDFQLPSSKSKSEPGKFIFDFFKNVNLTFETYDILLDLMEKVSSYLSTLSNAFQTRGVALQKFSDAIKLVFSALHDVKTSPFFGPDIGAIRESVSRNYRVHICEEDKRLRNKDIWKKEKAIVAKPGRTFSYWCFSPGYAMKELVGCDVHNLILTSGTLSPIDSFTSELQVDFPITLENSHVIDKYQMFASSLLVGVHGGKLELTYKNRSEESKVVELGRTVVEILKLSPGGVLVFFPSYAAMEQYVTAWKEHSNIMEMCELSKPCTVEPRQKGQMKTAIEKYYSDVKSPDGAALFAVCRGKVSEGLDFANDNGRAVVVIGIPFPPIKDPKVQLKMSFLDDLRRNSSNKTIAGQEWYRQQACRAVNQAIGRVIRHRYDYGAIVLCDHRYSRKEQVAELPKWVQTHMNQFDDCHKFLRRLKSFFCSVKEKEKLRSGLKNNVRDDHGPSTSKSNVTSNKRGHVSFSTTQDFVRTLPKFSDIDDHVPSMGCPWFDDIKQSGAYSCDAERCVFYDASRRQKSPKKDSPSSSKKSGLLDALNNTSGDFFNSSDVMEEDVPLQPSTHSLVLDKQRMESERSFKKKKIKIKPNSSFKPTSSSNVSPPSKENNHPDIITSDVLLKSPAAFFLDTLRQTQSGDNYLLFKSAVTRYKNEGQLQELIDQLSCILLDNKQSRELLRSFVRFIKVEHHELYKKEIESLILNRTTSS